MWVSNAFAFIIGASVVALSFASPVQPTPSQFPERAESLSNIVPVVPTTGEGVGFANIDHQFKRREDRAKEEPGFLPGGNIELGVTGFDFIFETREEPDTVLGETPLFGSVIGFTGIDYKFDRREETATVSSSDHATSFQPRLQTGPPAGLGAGTGIGPPDFQFRRQKTEIEASEVEKPENCIFTNDSPVRPNRPPGKGVSIGGIDFPFRRDEEASQDSEDAPDTIVAGLVSPTPVNGVGLGGSDFFFDRED
jgi:hypothetical protein